MSGDPSARKLDAVAQSYVQNLAREEGMTKIAQRVEELLIDYGTSDDHTLIWALQQAQNEADQEKIHAAAQSGDLRCNSD